MTTEEKRTREDGTTINSLVDREEYKGHQTLVILEPHGQGSILTHKKLISFGRRKAKAILDHIEDIKQFLKDTE